MVIGWFVLVQGIRVVCLAAPDSFGITVVTKGREVHLIRTIKIVKDDAVTVSLFQDIDVSILHRQDQKEAISTVSIKVV